MPFLDVPPLPPPVVEVRFTPSTPVGTWAPAALPVRFVLGTPAPRDVGSAIVAELDVALRTWSLPACTGFRGELGGVDVRQGADDGVNVVLVHDTAWPPNLVPGAVAQTVLHVNGDGTFRDADIHLNAADWRFSVDPTRRPGTLDLRSILVHELGHALGLGHSTDARATMAQSGSGLRWRSLEADDVAGVCALYPGAGDGGCPTTPCPEGFICAARRCQRPGEGVCAPCDPQDPATCEAAGDDARCAPVSSEGSPRACGVTCGATSDCGPGFTCRPTSEAGDLQCIADDACRSAGLPCAPDGTCPRGVCMDGVCLGDGAAVDAGVPSFDADPPMASPLEPGGSGCACRAAPSTPVSPILATVAPLLAVLLRRRRRARRAALRQGGTRFRRS